MFPLNIAKGLISIISTPPRKKKQLLEKKQTKRDAFIPHRLERGAFFSQQFMAETGEKSTLLRTAEETFLVGLERHSPFGRSFDSGGRVEDP